MDFCQVCAEKYVNALFINGLAIIGVADGTNLGRSEQRSRLSAEDW